MLHQRCCGLEVHKSSISTCILLHGSGRVPKHQRRFGAMTQDLHELAHWLKQFEGTQVAIAYASHCTSLGRCATFSSNCSLFDPSIVSRHWLSVMDRWIDGSMDQHQGPHRGTHSCRCKDGRTRDRRRAKSSAAGLRYRAAAPSHRASAFLSHATARNDSPVRIRSTCNRSCGQ